MGEHWHRWHTCQVVVQRKSSSQTFAQLSDSCSKQLTSVSPNQSEEQRVVAISCHSCGTDGEWGRQRGSVIILKLCKGVNFLQSLFSSLIIASEAGETEFMIDHMCPFSIFTSLLSYHFLNFSLPFWWTINHWECICQEDKNNKEDWKENCSRIQNHFPFFPDRLALPLRPILMRIWCESKIYFLGFCHLLVYT